MHAIETPFVKYEQQDHDAGSHAGGKPDDIDRRIQLVPGQVNVLRASKSNDYDFIQRVICLIRYKWMSGYRTVEERQA
jgi:hypothetical protein